ncbi:MAG: alpha-2-macroglobulin family protein [Gemmataceae bacterium]
MPRSKRFLALGAALCAAAVAAGLVATSDTAAQPRPEQWKKVQEAVNKGLPKTAIQELEPIIAAAIKDKAYPEAVKAVCTKINLEGNIQGNKPEEKVVRLKAAIATSPAEMHPVMNAVLAHWYWHYFQQNRYRIIGRTAAGDTTGDDVTTWDLPRILTEVERQFDRALAADKQLKATPVADYDILLQKGTIPDQFRPTMYDVLAFDALGFLAAGEHGLTKGEDSFEIAADSPVFAPVADFLKWQPKTDDAGSRLLKSVKLYQTLLTFHAGDENPSARLDADLHRLRFGHTRAVGPDKDAKYIAALERFVGENEKHELSAMARSLWARAEMGRGDRVKARQLALAGKAAFPDSPGGKLCHNVIVEIEAKSIQVATERTWADPQPDVRVTYRNLSRVHFRLVKADFVARLQRNQWRPEQIVNDIERKELLAQKPELAFTRDLPPTPDYQERTEAFAAPKGVAPGFYFLLASPDANFGENDNVVSVCDVWVSDLAVVSRMEQGTLRVGGFVLKGNPGTPVEGAKVQLWHRRPQGGWEAGETTATDRNGMYALAGRPQHGYLVVATHEKQQQAGAHDAYLFQHDFRERAQEQTVFFTDRSLYRPGQTIQFRGVCFRTDAAADKYETLPNRELTVVFSDANGQEVARQPVRTNEHGSFSGSVTAPRDRLTGRMTLHVPGGPNGATQVSVEEYKRPKFLVTTEAPREPAKLGAEVKVPGKAAAYTGAAVGGAKVKYRVVREVRYPAWFFEYCWWRPVPRQPAQEIAHGTLTTAPDGSFDVPFTAAPDRSVPESDEPTFRFTVTAEVTDTTGETRVGTQSVEVGYVVLRATVSAAEWQTADAPVKLTLNTASLDGAGREAAGTVKVYRLKTPERPARAELQQWFRPLPANAAPKPDPSKPVSWELGEVAHIAEFKTDGKGKAEADAKLPAGIYRVVVETKDAFGKPVTGKAQLLVLAPAADKLSVPLTNVVSSPKWSVEPGGIFTLYWGTGYESGRAFVEVEHRGRTLHAFWTDASKTQTTLTVPVTEDMRGGFTVRTTYVRENRGYLESRHVDVPWTNKQFTVKWETFRNKLEPGKRETFTAVITGPDAKRAAAEMAATLYDKSLDAYQPHHWQQAIGHFRQDHSRVQQQFENVPRQLHHLAGHWPSRTVGFTMTYRSLPPELTTNYRGYDYFGEGGGGGWVANEMMRGMRGGGDAFFARDGAPAPTAAMAPAAPGAMPMEAAGLRTEGLADKRAGGEPGGAPEPDLSKVAARTNLNETAFFFPHLVSDAEGVVRMEFTMPEALTTWRFMGIAHDRDLRSGFLDGEVVTAKDLMVQPNPPRFLREGDVLEYPVKVSNTSATRQQGKVRLAVRDARTDRAQDAELGIANAEQAFDLPAGESKTFSWKLTVPEGVGPLTFKAVAASDRHSDGEEGVVPVLSKRVLVQESLPLPIRGAGQKDFDFARLRNSAGSNSIRHQSFTIQMVSQPAWYAVMALPYLMEYPHECSEQTFNRLYANGLARHIANSDPKIRRVFDLWKGTPSLQSPLEKNADLKSVLLEETPWVRQAVKEGQARQNVGILFDANRLDAETARLNRRMAEMQYPDGMWPWFPGGRPNEYMTLYITTGYGRMRHLGVKQDVAPAVKAVTGLDAWMHRHYRDILRHGNPKDNHLSTTVALYLYGRSFFLADRPVANEHRAAWDYWVGQAKQYWLQLGHRQSQAHIAVALKRVNDVAAARGIMASIKERSVSNEEMGMFWRDLELQQFWFRAPIETQAMMIEAFDEVMNDQQAVEDCKVWLIKQKQTQDWKTTKATADAVYALLLRGENLLKSDALVEVTVGNRKIEPRNVEAGTGFYEEKFLRAEVQPSMSAISLKKTDAGVSWGSAHWSYLEDLDKVTVSNEGPLKLEKRLFLKQYTKQGPKLDPFARAPLGVGDELLVRLVLRTDRDMEYVHLKDHRGSGTEPVNVLSRYRFQDGLAYYESTKDTASHFFVDYLPKGNYVFEYPLRVQHRGAYTTGFAAIQCLYAPEFNSHSESIPLEAR